MDNTSLFEDLGFVAPEGSFLSAPCISQNFSVDSTAEIMGTQVSNCGDVAACVAACTTRTNACQGYLSVCEWFPRSQHSYCSMRGNEEMGVGSEVPACRSGSPMDREHIEETASSTTVRGFSLARPLAWHDFTINPN